METKKHALWRGISYGRRSKVSSGGLIDNGQWLDSGMLRDDPSPPATFDQARQNRACCWSADREVKSRLSEIRDLRRRCGQEDDLTTDPE